MLQTVNEDDADRIIERLTKTTREIRMEEIMSILTNTSREEYSHQVIQQLLMEYLELSTKVIE